MGNAFGVLRRRRAYTPEERLKDRREAMIGAYYEVLSALQKGDTKQARMEAVSGVELFGSIKSLYEVVTGSTREPDEDRNSGWEHGTLSPDQFVLNEFGEMWADLAVYLELGRKPVDLELKLSRLAPLFRSHRGG